MVVTSDNQKYIALNLSNPNSMKKYYEIAKVLVVNKSTYNKYENGKEN